MTVVDVEESTPASEGAAAGMRWGRWALVAVSMFVVYLIADIAVKPAISPLLVAGVSKAELEAAAVAEFQVEYDAINLGTPTAPFATSSQAADWAEHSKAVVANFAEITAAIKSGDREPVKVYLDSVGWVPAWNTPVLKMRVSIHDPAIKAGSWSGDEVWTQAKVIVGFHQVDGAWRVAWVDRQDSHAYLDNILADSCFRAVDGKVDGSACDYVPAG
ncbi:MAG: hypothetical protein RL441_1259 [Actinomycetota bacterium]|jgi:hypothetical protein